MAARDHDISLRANSVVNPDTFDDFYRTNASTIGDALEITLGNPELAEDALNEAMARALQRWKRVRAYDNPAGWVYRVAMNWALSWLRRRRREREQPVRLGPATSDIAPIDDELRQAIDSLSVAHRAVVVCRFFLDWSVAQTADSLEIPEGTVKSRLARALDNIRQSIEGATE